VRVLKEEIDERDMDHCGDGVGMRLLDGNTVTYHTFEEVW
jgi:hypothetical protein